MNTRELIERWPGLSDEDRASLLLAVSSRGKHKGYILSNSPAASRREAWSAWQALVGNLAPVRISIGSLILQGSDRYSALDDAVTSSGLGGALMAIEPAFRWNLYAHRHDIDRERLAIESWLEKGERKTG